MGLRAMFNSISGLLSNSVWLDVTGNNISNVNTVAYKSSRAEFADQFSQTLSGGTGANPGSDSGGINPQQIGTGTRPASIETLFTQGPSFITGNSTDISIQGDGFLVARQGSQTYLTRAGNLIFDGAGYLVDQNGGRIQGLNASVLNSQRILNSAGNVGLVTTTDESLQIDSSNPTNLTSIKIDRDFVLPPKATSEVKFQGNLDSFQQANVLDLFPGGPFAGPGPTLPVAIPLAFVGGPIDANRMRLVGTPGGGFALQQVSFLSNFTPGVFAPPAPLENGFIPLWAAIGAGGNYAWDHVPPTPPAHQIAETVYDSLGNTREITVQFYQVNDLGTAKPPINTPPMSQVCYAWYAFDTTGGKPVATPNLLGGTGIGEGTFGFLNFYDRGIPGNANFGDFIWFNTDGSLGSSGGVGGFPGPPGLNFNFQTVPRVYLPPMNFNPPVSTFPVEGAAITAVDLNFGTSGIPGFGRRDGLIGDAEGSYQLIKGVNTYVPNHTAYAASQNGYPDGNLQGMSFDGEGSIVGSFSNGQNIKLAQLVMEQVANPEGLNKVGSNYFTTSPNSGAGRLGMAAHGNFGKIQGNSLEGSNVDLTVELSNMIVAQRGFEVNAMMVSVVSDTMKVTDDLGR